MKEKLLRIYIFLDLDYTVSFYMFWKSCSQSVMFVVLPSTANMVEMHILAQHSRSIKSETRGGVL